MSLGANFSKLSLEPSAEAFKTPPSTVLYLHSQYRTRPFSMDEHYISDLARSQPIAIPSTHALKGSIRRFEQEVSEYQKYLEWRELEMLMLMIGSGAMKDSKAIDHIRGRAERCGNYTGTNNNLACEHILSIAMSLPNLSNSSVLETDIRSKSDWFNRGGNKQYDHCDQRELGYDEMKLNEENDEILFDLEM